MSVNKRNPETGELVTLASGARMWVGTQSAHDNAVANGTMPNNCMVCITDDYGDATVDSVTNGDMHPVTSNAVANSLSYSTEETLTGGTWIDGKPIYRKVFTGTLASPNGEITFDLPNVSVKTITGTTYGNNNCFPVPYCFYSNSDSQNYGVYVYHGSDRIHLSFFSSVSDYFPIGTTVELIVEYTKTTD